MKIQERAVRINGETLWPGDPVVVLCRPHAGRIGKFKGKLSDGRLVVAVNFARFSRTLLRLGKDEIERSNS